MSTNISWDREKHRGGRVFLDFDLQILATTSVVMCKSDVQKERNNEGDKLGGKDECSSKWKPTGLSGSQTQ